MKVVAVSCWREKARDVKLQKEPSQERKIEVCWRRSTAHGREQTSSVVREVWSGAQQILAKKSSDERLELQPLFFASVSCTPLTSPSVSCSISSASVTGH